jgi:hypothetical protein
MSTPNVTIGRTGPGEHWEPAITPREAVTLGIPKSEYEQAALLARTAVEEHQRLGTPREHREPTPIVNDKLAAPFISDGGQELKDRLEREADPALDQSQDLVGNVRARLDEIAEAAQPISTPESGVTYSVADAVARVALLDETIRQDGAAGKYHNRVPMWLMRLATLAPWLEAVGFLTFVTYYLNVSLFEPWQDWLGWSFAAVVVVVIILGQTTLVRHAGNSHNHAREIYRNGLRIEGEQEFKTRNEYLAVTTVTVVVITGGMIWRGTAALGNASLGTTAVMVFAAAVTGLLLPILAYLAIALDGSTISRERDGLAAELDADLADYLDAVSDSRRDLDGVAETGGTLTNKTLPDICNATQETVDAVYEFYGTVRLLIGGLKADPPTRTTKTISTDPAGKISGYIGTSIPGAGSVNLDPLLDRQHRLDDIEAQRADLLNRIDALKQHPWGTSRTV